MLDSPIQVKLLVHYLSIYVDDPSYNQYIGKRKQILARETMINNKRIELLHWQERNRDKLICWYSHDVLKLRA